MKNKNLKTCFAILFSFAMCSLKAQSVQQKFQKDMELRKKHVSAVRLKAREQQVQQQAERLNQPNFPQQDAAGSSTIQPAIKTAPGQLPGKTEIKSQLRPVNKKL